MQIVFVAQRVLLQHGDVIEVDQFLARQLVQMLIDLNGHHVRGERRHLGGQRAHAGADFEHDIIGPQFGRVQQDA